MEYSKPPAFRAKGIDGYQFTVVAIFPDIENKCAATRTFTSEVLLRKDAVSPLHVELDVPLNAQDFLVCLRIEGCINGVVHDSRATSGMCVGGGKLLLT